MKAIYISGKYSANTNVQRQRNIDAARLAAEEVWSREGCYAVCPHLNTAHMDGVFSPDPVLDYEKFIEADLDLVRRCDAIFLLAGYRESNGAMRELAEAVACGKKVFVEEEKGWQKLSDWVYHEMQVLKPQKHMGA